MAIRLVSVFAFFLALAILKTWPLVLHAGTHVPIYGDSPYHMGWILAWGAHALGTDPRHLFDANLAYPLERSFAFSEHMLGLQPLYAPLYALTGNPTVGYNALFVLSFALSAFTAFALAWHLTGAVAPALVAGTLFGFAPFRFGQINHLHILAFFWAPLALLSLDRYLRRRRRRDLAAVAVVYWLQALASVQLAFLVTVALVTYAAYHALIVDRSLLSRATLVDALAFGAASLVVLGPVHLPYVDVQRTWGTPWTEGTLIGGSADLRDFLRAPPFISDVYIAASRRIVPMVDEDRMLFPGLMLPALAVLGLVSQVRGVPATAARRLRVAFGIMTVTALGLALGPYLLVGRHNTHIPLPYWLLYHALPGWGSIRIPARFVLLAVLAATPLAALGAMRCAEALADVRWRWLRRLAPLSPVVLVALSLAELGTRPLPLDETPTARRPEVYGWLARQRPGPLLELPMGLDVEMRYLYLSTLHWLPVVTPRGSFAPQTHDDLRDILAESPAPRGLRHAGALGVKAILVHTDRLGAEDAARWAFRDRAGGARRLAAFGPHVVYAPPVVDTTPVLSARLAVPSSLPAGRVVRLGLLLTGGDERAWAHPPPYGLSSARVEWTGPDGARTDMVELAFPLVVGGGESAPLQLRLETPATPGRYALRVSVPARGIETESKTVAVRAEAPPTSVQSPRALAAEYRHGLGPAPLSIAAFDVLELTLSAINRGQAVWLAKAADNRGEVALRWRWLRDGRELEGLTRRQRVRYDVFPGEPYAFRVVAPVPAAPGAYVFEVGLVSERVAAFTDVGSPPVSLHVQVR